MSHYIVEPCIGTKDTSCVDVCPVDCIHPRPEAADFETEQMLYIDKSECIDCGLCIDECPVQAIFPEERLPEEQQRFVRINDDYFARKRQTPSPP